MRRLHTIPICTTLACLLLLLSPLLISCGTQAQATGDGSRPVTQKIKPNFTHFAGTWNAHFGTLTVDTNGNARYIGRVYTWCNRDVKPPCDSIVGNAIKPGLNVTMLFTSANDKTANGTIQSSTDGKTGVPVTLTLDINDTIMLREAKSPELRVLCGPSAPVGTCGA